MNNASLAWNDLFSSRKIQNAAYWKIANVELGYNFPNMLPNRMHPMPPGLPALQRSAGRRVSPTPARRRIGS